MSPQYDDDDLIDYDEDYYEDEMGSEEEENLHMAMAQVKSLLGTAKANDEEITESLYHYDFDVDRVAKYLKDKHEARTKPKSQSKSTPTPPPKGKLELSDEPGSASTTPRQGSTGQGLTGLAALAAKRTQSGSSNDASSTPSKLQSLAMSRLSSPSGQVKQLSSVGLLDRLGTKSALSSPKPAFKLGSASPLAKIAKTSRERVPSEPTSTPARPRKRIKCFPAIDLDVPFGTPENLLHTPSSFGVVFTMGHKLAYHAPGVANAAYETATAAAKQAFSGPSPDDIVLRAQEQGFNKAVSNLHIAETPKAPPKRTTPLLNIEEELNQTPIKPVVNFVVIGHVDAGKSTLMGRMLYDVGAVDKHSIDKYAKESSTIGKGSFAFAWVMDQTEEERNRGVTIDIATSNFETDEAVFTIVDAPGHRDFVPNMIAGSSQADIALLVVDAAVDAFEAGFDLDGQTKEHAILVRSLGVDRIIVAVNKLDTTDWSESRFDQIRFQLTEFLSKVGFATNKLCFVPTSGLNGDNVVKRKELPWYKGPTLLEQLEASKPADAVKDHLRSLRLTVLDAYSASHTSDISIQGRIDSGAVQVGETLKVSPSGAFPVVKSLSVNGDDSKKWAVIGDNVVMSVTNVELDQVNVGDVVSNFDSEVTTVTKFKSRIVLFDLKRPILKGTQLLLHRGRTNKTCKVTKLISIIDKSSGQVIKQKPRLLTSGQTAVVEIELESGIPMEPFASSKELGRFVLRKDGSTTAAGVVDEISV